MSVCECVHDLYVVCTSRGLPDPNTICVKETLSFWRATILGLYQDCSIMKQVEICQSIYHMGSLTDPNDENSPIEVGHNIYILAVQLAHHKKELKEALERSAHKTGDPIQYYSSRIAKIEVGREGGRGERERRWGGWRVGEEEEGWEGRRDGGKGGGRVGREEGGWERRD